MQEWFITPDDRLQAVCDRAPPGTTIYLSPGVYRQKTVIRTPNLTLIGAGADKTRIVWDDYARRRGSDGFELITFRSYTLCVCADGVRMESLTVQNDAGSPAEKGQQVALSVVADGFSMENCCLRSTQDTLFCGPLPPDLVERYEGFLPDELRRDGHMSQYFRNCRIEGSVDFIFGCGEAVFDGCCLHSVADGRDTGFLAAPAHGTDQPQGFEFRNCRLSADEAVAEGSVYLARPWRDYGMCRFVCCHCGSHIHPAGFSGWSGTQREKTARFFEQPPVSGRADWINPTREVHTP